MSRIGLIYIIALLASAAIVGKIVYLQFFIADEWKEDIKRYSQRSKEVPANRGNILDSDGNIIASTVPTYNISIDPNSDPMDPVIFDKEVSGLAQGLAQLFGEQSAWYYENRIRSARKNKSRHLLLVKNASYQEKEKVKDLPLFRHGPYKGGMKIEVVSSRKRPYNSLAKRTIGYSREGDGNKYIGLEGMFDSYLKGKDGERVEYRLGGSNWVPASSVNSKDPVDGIDIVSTLNMNYQDVAESALRELLEKNQADHGCAILMEVSTGHIKAMVNLGRIEDGSYHEIYNYAVGEKHEPGSTFKLPSLIAALETGRISLEDTVNTFRGVYKFGGEDVKDSNRDGYGVITVQQVFEKYPKQ